MAKFNYYLFSHEEDNQLLNKNRIVAIDCDTDGLSKTNNNLIAIHAIEIIDRKITGKYFHAFINKRKYNGDFIDYLAEYNYHIPVEKKILTFLNFVSESTIVSHNINFDIGFINAEIEKIQDKCKNNIDKYKKIDTKKCVCTMKIMRNYLWYYSLFNSAIFYDIAAKDFHYHKGIVDVTILGRMICKMVNDPGKNYNVDDYMKKYMKKCLKTDAIIERKKEKKLLSFNDEKNTNKNENKKALTSNSKKDVNKNENKKVLISNNKKDANENESKLKIEADSLNINDSDVVYLSRTGKCFHIKANCNNAKNMSPCSLGDALAMGRLRCKKCYNHASKTEFNNK